ncbi:MAG: CoA-transferase [Nocardioidaceae bacterium]
MPTRLPRRSLKAVYECAVPVIAAVNGFCVGGGVGLVGNADCIVASEDAYFGVPEVNQGALGAATHMARLVPQHMMRTLYFTARTIKAADLVQFGSVLEVVPREELDAAALNVAKDIAAKDTRVIRAAKEALNGIDPIDGNKSLLPEQGFTMELNLAWSIGATNSGDEFAGNCAPSEGKQRMSMPSAEMTAEQVIEQIEDGMTVGIGGWGSRRKPMALVRAILRSNLKDLTLISYAGPDAGLLLDAACPRDWFILATLDSIPLEPLFSRARQDKTAKFREWDEGMFQTGLRAAASRVPFLPMRAGLGSAVMENDPTLKTVTSPYDDGETLLAVPALELDVALVHMNRADKYGNAQYLGPDPYFDDLFCMAAKKAYVSTEQIMDTAGMLLDAPIQSMLLNRTMAGVVDSTGAHFTTCSRPMSVTRFQKVMPPQPRPLRIGPPSKLDSCRGAKLTTKTPCRHSPRRPTDE